MGMINNHKVRPRHCEARSNPVFSVYLLDCFTNKLSINDENNS